MGWGDLAVSGHSLCTVDISASQLTLFLIGHVLLFLLLFMCRAIVKKLAVKFDGNAILSLDDINIFECYQDLCEESEKQNAMRQGIIHSGSCSSNCMKLGINAGNKDASSKQANELLPMHMETSLPPPLDFEMLDNAMPYYQLELRNILCYEITFNDYD